MITIENLNKFSEQEVFDFVVKHLLSQGEPSFYNGTTNCAYRGENGFKCAVGCLIPDEWYDESMESYTWPEVLKMFILPEYADSYTNLLDKLQFLHDLVPCENWKEELENLAIERNLNWNF